MVPVVSSCSDDEKMEDIVKDKIVGDWKLGEVYYYGGTNENRKN